MGEAAHLADEHRFCYCERATPERRDVGRQPGSGPGLFACLYLGLLPPIRGPNPASVTSLNPANSPMPSPILYALPAALAAATAGNSARWLGHAAFEIVSPGGPGC